MPETRHIKRNDYETNARKNRFHDLGKLRPRTGYLGSIFQS